jgi:serine/threonine-protein kinase
LESPRARKTDKDASSRLARMERVVDAMKDRSDRIEQLKKRMLGLEARGRDFRTTIGRAVDALAGDLSVKSRERDSVASERERLERERERVAASAGEADALLWQIAASEEVLREAVAAVEDVEYQLRELSGQLDRLSGALEADQNELVTDLDQTLRQLADDDAELRGIARNLEPG